MVDYQPLGDSGLVVSTVGIGCNAFGTRIDQDTVDDVVDAALDAGVNFFDTADTYGRGLSEEMLGRALQGRRQDVVVATKFGMDMEGANGPDHGARASRRYIRRAVEASLRRLQTDHIDLYQLHQPDLVTPLEETLSALGELVVEGARVLGRLALRDERAEHDVTEHHRRIGGIGGGAGTATAGVGLAPGGGVVVVDGERQDVGGAGAAEEFHVEVGDRGLVDEDQRHLGVVGRVLVVEHQTHEPQPAFEVDLDVALLVAGEDRHQLLRLLLAGVPGSRPLGQHH